MKPGMHEKFFILFTQCVVGFQESPAPIKNPGPAKG